MTMTFTEAIEAAVEERGAAWEYPKYEEVPTSWHGIGGECLYVTSDTKQPACIVGLALAKMGFAADQMDVITNAPEIMEQLDVGSNEERCAAMCAQEVQDNGGSWGEALKEYHNSLDVQAAEREYLDGLPTYEL